jgi:predicted nucleic acid-binding protein
MTVYYLDSSAWIKHFLKEPGSSWVSRLFEQHRDLLASASLGYVEVSSALVRQQVARNLAPEAVDRAMTALDTNWHAFFQVELTREIANLAVSFARKWKLRGADAMHLGAADYSGSSSVSPTSRLCGSHPMRNC